MRADSLLLNGAWGWSVTVCRGSGYEEDKMEVESSVVGKFVSEFRLELSVGRGPVGSISQCFWLNIGMSRKAEYRCNLILEL